MFQFTGSLNLMPNDHDLLIEINTKLERAIKDIAEIKDTTADRVNALEQEKLDKAEAARLKEEADTVHQDHEIRLRAIEKKIWTAAGATAIASTGVATIINQFLQ
jgi:hypothetical protein